MAIERIHEVLADGKCLKITLTDVGLGDWSWMVTVDGGLSIMSTQPERSEAEAIHSARAAVDEHARGIY